MDANLPQRLYDGYRAFRAGRLPTEQSRYRELAETGRYESVVLDPDGNRLRLSV